MSEPKLEEALEKFRKTIEAITLDVQRELEKVKASPPPKPTPPPSKTAPTKPRPLKELR